MNANAERVELDSSTTEVYKERPVYFIEKGTGAILYGMAEYRAGNGQSPMVGDQMVLQVKWPEFRVFEEGHMGESVDLGLALDGVYRVVQVEDGNLEKSVFLSSAQDPNESYWGVTVEKAAEIEDESQVDHVEKAGLISMI